MARLVRGVVLTVRDLTFVDAAVTLGTPVHRILRRHILPSTLGPLTVQATYACASAIITESVLSFIGAGVPASIPSWGNMMADGRQLFEIAPWVDLLPGRRAVGAGACREPDRRHAARATRPAARRRGAL